VLSKVIWTVGGGIVGSVFTLLDLSGFFNKH